jgi:hypothetical protein
VPPDYSGPDSGRLKPVKSGPAKAETYNMRFSQSSSYREAFGMLRASLAALILSTGWLFAVPDMASAAAASGEPGWLGVVVARGELKQWIDSTPIVERPNRPFHFYGNAVRREYYRGTLLPRPGDMVKGGAALIVKRP